MTAYRLALATVAATFVLLLVGGTVNPTGSALACPDWPLCHGTAFPEFQGGVQYEHSHRLAAAAVSLLTVLLALVTWRTPGTSRRARKLTLALVGVVALQAILGGVTVLLRLPTLVSTAHLALSMAFFLLTLLAVAWLRPGAAASESLGRRPAGIALAAVYAQILLGGFVRHTGAGRACGDDFPQCGGEWWPDLWAARANMAHRFGGVVVLLVVVACSIPSMRRAAHASRKLALGAAAAGPLLVLVQVGLGILTVTSYIGFPQVMAHFAVGALLLAACQTCFLGLGPSGASRTALDARLAGAALRGGPLAGQST